jgi:hypothetical protein
VGTFGIKDNTERPVGLAANGEFVKTITIGGSAQWVADDGIEPPCSCNVLIIGPSFPHGRGSFVALHQQER